MRTKIIDSNTVSYQYAHTFFLVSISLELISKILICSLSFSLLFPVAMRPATVVVLVPI